MEEYRTISQNNPAFPPYLNFQTLRELGIKHLQKLSGKIWTDYNLHDPGVTILEVLCYAITDLGYRNNLDIEDLLTLKPGDKTSRENNFFTPDQILTCNPVTELDWRKRLIDIEGVRNAWLEKIDLETYEPAITINWDQSCLQYYDPNSQESESESENRFYPRGLYRVWLDLEPNKRQDPCGQPYQSRSEVLEEVNQVLFSYRNLCEDFQEVMVLEAEEIGLCCDIELTRDADPEDVLVGIYVQVQKFLRPPVQFYTLKQLLDKGKNLGEIFAGRPAAIPSNDTSFPNWSIDPVKKNLIPYSHGFIDVEQLPTLMPPPVLHTSDLYQEILKVPGVAAVRKLRISSYINGLQQSEWESWRLPLSSSYYPTLGINHAQVKLYKEGLPLGVDRNEVEQRYFEQQEVSLKVTRDAYELDLPVPQGRYYETLADHYSIQHDFPLTYGISEEGLPDNVSALRKAQAKQLKGYLVFFDQLLANYLSQLAHVRDLFSWESDNDQTRRSLEQQHTYFTQSFDFPGREDILKETDYLNAIEEDKETYRERRNRFLDHLLARFAESFAEYALLNYQVQQNNQDKMEIETNLIEDKAKFLRDYPTLARDRFRAFNYSQTPTWNTDKISGFQQRVSALLGIENLKQRSLSPAPLQLESKDFIWYLDLDISSTIVLQSQQAYSGEDEARNGFEKFLELAQNPQQYERLSITDQGTPKFSKYSYVILDSESIPLAFSPQRYTTPEERDLAITALQELLSESPDASIQEREAGYIGQVKDAEVVDQIWLQGTQRYPTEKQAWQDINDLIKLAEEKQNFQLIDGDKGKNLYGWELNHTTKASPLFSDFYPTPKARDKALKDLREGIRKNSLKMEGFHVLEHILLRPRTIWEGHSIVPIVWLLLANCRYVLYLLAIADSLNKQYFRLFYFYFHTLIQQSLVNTMAGILFFRKSLILDRFLPICVSPEDASTLIGELPHLIWQDPYSFWISIILPYWPQRFQNINFRRFVEQTLRLETPAHVALRIAWLDTGQMRAFEDAYRAWLEQLALATQENAYELTGSLNHLLDILSQLRSVYPEGNLYGSQASTSPTNSIILNQTVLGSTQ